MGILTLTILTIIAAIILFWVVQRFAYRVAVNLQPSDIQDGKYYLVIFRNSDAQILEASVDSDEVLFREHNSFGFFPIDWNTIEYIEMISIVKDSE